MRFRTYEEATAFVKALLKARQDGKREHMTARLDSVPAWSGVKKDPAAPEWVPDGSEVEAVYLSYMEADEKQKEEAKPAKLAGVKLERMSGRLVDVRLCKDGTCQLLLVSGLRDAAGKPAFRGPNVDKGILCYLAIGEGLGESVDEIIARVPANLKELLAKQKEEGKPKAKAKAKAKPVSTEPVQVTVPVQRGATIIDVPSANPTEPGRMKLK